jgi:hypothetical protein
MADIKNYKKSSNVNVKDATKAGNVSGTTYNELYNALTDGTSTNFNVASMAGPVVSTGATDGVGYATGAGGAVTQITSASTGVAVNTVCGQITTVALTTAAAAEEVFTVTNSTVAATDVVVVSTTYAGGGTILCSTKATAAGSFDVAIANLHASAALDALAVINFAVIKAVAA